MSPSVPDARRSPVRRESERFIAQGSWGLPGGSDPEGRGSSGGHPDPLGPRTGPPPGWRGTVNWINLSTPAGLALAKVGADSTCRSRDDLWLAFGYRLRLPKAPAFTLGSVILLRRPTPKAGIDAWDSVPPRLLAHESRHATQYAYFGGVVMPVAYLAAAGWSWIRAGDWGSHNYFERAAGLADGGYRERPVRPISDGLRAALLSIGARRLSQTQ